MMPTSSSVSMPLFPQLAEMSEEDKLRLVARYLPCDVCPTSSSSACRGWRPKSDSSKVGREKGCRCGHDFEHHVDKGQDLNRRLKVALRLNELLEEKGQTEDYEDEDITSLKK
ncbi:hypothetical protein BDF20DRAFT_151378 [Mycotypha africana]|uniref:uncharacterized protein n=1 Tax=Mycotypha africana TaxID=64632 RepID=UPI00230191BA|nr:uncharacterized protein BDF20DRAFT_151378 [Mycotypha africana]KAI8969225.1 hypothetical protein BDF20DRAFT_151378 [Mycotypha africana]